MHVETMFVRPLNAILARNRLLRSARSDRGETAFFAVKPGPGAELVGYEDSRIRFIGEGSLIKPTGCERWRWRKLNNEGKLWPFDPAASFSLERRCLLPVKPLGGRVHCRPLRQPSVGRRIDCERASASPLFQSRSCKSAFTKRAPSSLRTLYIRVGRSAFSADGKALSLTHRTPRPWAHVMANEIGMATMVSNDGEIFSAFGNARQNGLSAFRFDSVTAVQPGQIVYLRDLDKERNRRAGLHPFSARRRHPRRCL